MKNFIISSVLFFAAATTHAAALERSFFQCIQDRLNAYNSSVYYNISKDELIDILDNSQDGRSADVVRTAKTCLDNPNP